MIRRHFLALAFAGASLGLAAHAAAQQRAICYNCPPEWADWGSQLKAIKAKLGIEVPPDNKNSGQSLSALIAEKAKPVADVTYLGGSFADSAKAPTSRATGTGSRTTSRIPPATGSRSTPARSACS
jgi:putative spermidine/putrescine transport system substrate-binding protein